MDSEFFAFVSGEQYFQIGLLFLIDYLFYFDDPIEIDFFFFFFLIESWPQTHFEHMQKTTWGHMTHALKAKAGLEVHTVRPGGHYFIGRRVETPAVLKWPQMRWSESGSGF